MIEKQLVEKAVKEGKFLIDHWEQLLIEKSKSFSTQLPFALYPSQVQCFIGKIEMDEITQDLIGVCQKYIISKNLKIGEKLRLHANINKQQNLFEFIPVSFENQKDDHIFDLKIHPFYDPLKLPNRFKSYFKKHFPMSAYVVTSPNLNKSLKTIETTQKESLTYCYAFIEKQTGPSFLGYGPGKFEKAIKHYSLTSLNAQEEELILTGVILPRSKKMLKLGGFDPIYGFAKLVNWITFKQFNVFEKVQDQLEFQMLEHHVKVHEEMLSSLLEN